MKNYNFEWDQIKARSNMNKHKISFGEAATVFQDPMALSIFDNEHSEKEDRWITIGLSATGRVILVCHTFKEEDNNNVAIRIFSTRKATKQEIKEYKG